MNNSGNHWSIFMGALLHYKSRGRRPESGGKIKEPESHKSGFCG